MSEQIAAWKKSPWCRAVRSEMAKRGWDVNDLAREIGKTREYTSAIINGRINAEPTIKLISDTLNIVENACSLIGN